MDRVQMQNILTSSQENLSKQPTTAWIYWFLFQKKKEKIEKDYR